MPENLPEWLDFISLQHVSEIELGLNRMGQVADKLGLQPFSCPQITVAGTNGKGSSITALENFYTAAGYQTACYTSPHLTVFNERIRINGDFVTDEELCGAFEAINIARADIPLTYFEFATLAAFLLFSKNDLDVVLLEVGLGGRLDATNLFPADVALITRIAIDHSDWLGDDREQIGAEKAGIIHAGKIAVISDTEPPSSLLAIAKSKAACVYIINQDFRYEINQSAWDWRYNGSHKPQGEKKWLKALPLPRLSGLPQFNNLSGVLMVLDVLHQTLPVSEVVIEEVLSTLELKGRFQVLGKDPLVILDVAHNPDSTELLANNLKLQVVSGKTHAIVGMLKGKDILQSLNKVYAMIDEWHVTSLQAARGESAQNIKKALLRLGENTKITEYDCVEKAWEQAGSEISMHDRLVVFGSFHTVGGIISLLSFKSN